MTCKITSCQDVCSLTLSFVGDPNISLVCRAFHRSMGGAYLQIAENYLAHSAIRAFASQQIHPCNKIKNILLVQKTSALIIDLYNTTIAAETDFPFSPLSIADRAEALQDHYLLQFLRGWAKTNLEPIEAREIREEFFLKQEVIARVVHLNLFETFIQGVPREIQMFSCLEILDLSANKLQFLTPEIRHLKNLKKLEINSNFLPFLPEELGECTAINHLNAADNQLTTLPYSIGKLTRLQILYLDDNPITHLPEEIGGCTQLKELCIEGGRITTVPQELAGCRLLERVYL